MFLEKTINMLGDEIPHGKKRGEERGKIRVIFWEQGKY